MVLIAILFIVSEVGYAAFAIQNPSFDCESMPRGAPIAMLWGDFGDSDSCLHNLHPSILLIHFSNEACRRKRRCSRGGFLPGYSLAHYESAMRQMRPLELAAVRRRVKSILVRVAGASPRFILSAGLEDNLGRSAAKKLISTLRRYWPYEISRNPVVDMHLAGADFLESHSLLTTPAAPCIASNDGADIRLGVAGRKALNGAIAMPAARRWAERMRHCEIRFNWIREFNCLSDSNRFSYPRSRSCERLGGVLPALDDLR